jgi:hypothetical protein
MKQWYNSSKIAAKIKADYELPEKDRVEYEPQSGFGKRMNKVFFKIVLHLFSFKTPIIYNYSKII